MAGLGWAASPQRDGPFARGLQVPLEQKSPLLQCSVASGPVEFTVSCYLQMFYGLWVRSYVYVRLSTPPSWLRPLEEIF